ncbi:MAG: sensor domain-containing diguanylate cyclase [bacterium]|nr:sensor domain-containing diguanylate cyclase [bacterium]
MPSASTRITEAGESELVIRTLYEITSDYKQGFERQVQRILELGCRRFDLDIGILSKILGNRYEVRHFRAPEGASLHQGQTFPLGDTYCAITMQADRPTGFEHVAESEICTHPAYGAFRLEAYIGTPVVVDDEVFGTLNFSSARPHPRKFREPDIDALQLMATWVAAEIHRRRTEEALREATDELRHLTRIDPMTELLNRRGIEDSLVRIGQRLLCRPESCIALLVDLDDFKSVNDGYGHAAGDAVIVETARRIRKAVRPTDIAGRVGGDEFLILLPDCDPTMGDNIAERVRAALCHRAVETPREPVRITASIGVAHVPAGCDEVSEVIGAAGGALSRSKKSGKNTVAG